MKFLYFILYTILVIPTAFGQSSLPTPPPQNSVTTSGNAMPVKTLGAVFSDLEKQIIRDTLEAVNQKVNPSADNATSGTSKQSPVKSDTSSSMRSGKSNDDDDETHERRNHSKAKGRSKHKKGHKNKSRGKGSGKGMPPGLAKRDKLPPGLQKQLERNGTLPPGLQKRKLPDTIEEKLAPPQEGTERVIVNQDVVLIDKATNTVLDIIKGVLNK
jgi:hypothetical protein